MHVAFDPTAAYCRRGLLELDVLACTEGVSACLYTMRRVDRRVLRVGRHAVHVIEGKRRVVQRCSERPPQPNLCRPKCCLNSLGTRKIRARACVSVCGTVNSVQTKRACFLFCTGVSGSKAAATSKHGEIPSKSSKSEKKRNCHKYYGEFRGLVPGLFGFHPPLRVRWDGAPRRGRRIAC